VSNRREPGSRCGPAPMGGGVSVSRASADAAADAERAAELHERQRLADALVAKDKVLQAMSKGELRREVLSARADMNSMAGLVRRLERTLEDRERDVRELRRVVNVLGDDKVALESAVTVAEDGKAAVVATADLATADLAKRDATIAELGRAHHALQERSSAQDLALQQLQRQLQRSESESRGAIALLASELEARTRELATSQDALKQARQDIAGVRRLVKAVMQEADRRIYEEQKRHSDVSFLRSKLVALYQGESGIPGPPSLINA